MTTTHKTDPSQRSDPRGDRRVCRRCGRAHLRHGPGRRGGDERLSRRPARLVPLARGRGTGDARRSSLSGPAPPSATRVSGWSSRPCAASSSRTRRRPSADTGCRRARRRRSPTRPALRTSVRCPGCSPPRPRTCPSSSRPTEPAAGVSWEALGADARESQAALNRPWFEGRLGGCPWWGPRAALGAWPAGCPDPRRRLWRWLVDDRSGACLSRGQRRRGGHRRRVGRDGAQARDAGWSGGASRLPAR